MFEVWLLAAVSILLAFMIFMGAIGRTSHQGSWGLRNDNTTKSQEAWVAAHRTAAMIIVLPSLIVAGICAAIGLGAFAKDHKGIYAGALVVYAIVLIVGTLRGNKSAKQINAIK